MSYISSDLKNSLGESLLLYYSFISSGDLKRLSSLMTKESYFLTLGTLGFKKAFRDENFKHLLEDIGNDANSLLEVEKALSQELRQEARQSIVEVVSYEEKGLDRVTVHYLQGQHPKKMYFSNQLGSWKIDFKAGRKKI